MVRSTFRFFLGAALISAVAVATPVSYTVHPTPCTTTLPPQETVEPSAHPIYPGDLEPSMEPSAHPIYPGDIDDQAEPSEHPVYPGEVDDQVEPSAHPIYPGDIEPSMEPSAHPIYPGDLDDQAEPSEHPVYPGDLDDQVEPSTHPVYPGDVDWNNRPVYSTDVDDQAEPSAHPVAPCDLEKETATPTPVVQIQTTKRCHIRSVDLKNRTAERCCNVRYSCSSKQCSGSSTCSKPNASFCRKPVCKKVYIHYSLAKELSGDCAQQML